jgi:mevalonate kinase
MKWQIPAKTFLLGEYCALAGQSAIVLTTTPYFELTLKTVDNCSITRVNPREVGLNCQQTLTHERNLNSIHPHSPAGRWWQEQALDEGLVWTDPYQGRGGLGASSGQFVAIYLAVCHLKKTSPTLDHMLKAYHQVAWSGKGLRPSAYDVMAQSQQACVFINQQNQLIESHAWPFEDLSFFLLHTGVKLATHHHLQEITLPKEIPLLSTLVEKGIQAFKKSNSNQIIECINAYHSQLARLHLVTEHSLNSIETLKTQPEILAIKGCGALGADVLLIVCASSNKSSLKKKLLDDDWTILATESELSTHAHWTAS